MASSYGTILAWAMYQFSRINLGRNVPSLTRTSWMDQYVPTFAEQHSSIVPTLPEEWKANLVLGKPVTLHIRVQLLQQPDAALRSWLSQAILIQKEIDSEVCLIDHVFVCNGELANP